MAWGSGVLGSLLLCLLVDQRSLDVFCGREIVLHCYIEYMYIMGVGRPDGGGR
jgi:hypothetical protein